MIRFEKVNKIYKNKKRKVNALIDASIAFDNKGLFCIVGESGAGKSTFLNLLCLQDKPNSGKIIIDGYECNKLSDKELSWIRNEYFGIVFQDLNLIDSFDIRDNLVISYLMKNEKIKENEIVNVLQRLGLDASILHEDIYSLSGGQRQRIAIARALLKNAKIIVCDEPTGSLDEEMSYEIFKILKEISKEKLVIVVTHSKRLANEFADEVINIHKGKLITQNDENKIKINSSCSKIKVKIPSFKLLRKLTFNSFKETISKSILTLVSVCTMLSVLLFGLTLITFDKNKTIGDALIKNNVNGIMVEKIKQEESTSKIVYFENEDKAKFDGYESISICYFNRLVPKNSGVEYLTAYSNKLNYELMGNVPKYSESTCEVVITRYLACYALNLVDESEINNNEALKEIIGKEIKIDTGYYYATGDDDLKQYSYQFTVTGIIDTKYSKNSNDEYENDTLSYELHSCLFVSQEDMNSFIGVIQNNIGDYSYCFDRLFLLNPENTYFDESKINTNTSYSYQFNTKLDDAIGKMSSAVDIYGEILISVSLFFIVIAVILFINYINLSVENYIDKIKIIRALGFSKKDCALVFIGQGVIISTISMIVAVLIYAIGGIIVNNYLANQFNLFVNPIRFDWLISILVYIGLIALNSLFVYLKIKIKFKESKRIY